MILLCFMSQLVTLQRDPIFYFLLFFENEFCEDVVPVVLSPQKLCIFERFVLQFGSS